MTANSSSIAPRDDAVHRLWLDRDEVSVLGDLKSLDKHSSDLLELRIAVAQLLQSTTSNSVRNAAALALVDLGGDDAAQIIIDVLHRPDVAKASGTLIYAVDELGASIPLSVLARLLERGSYEARSQALSFLEEGRVARSSDDEWEDGRRVLAALAVSDDAEAAEAGRTALDHLGAETQP